MSLIITIYTSEGVVMASDSRTTFTKDSNITGHFTDNAYKTFLCPNKCGISHCGASSIGDKMLAGLIDNFIMNSVSELTTISDTAHKLKDYVESLDSKKKCTFHVAGYEETYYGYKLFKYHVTTGPNGKVEENTNEGSGAFWDGEIDVLSKIINASFACNNSIEVNNITITSEQGTKKYDEAYLLPKNSTRVFEKKQILWNFMTLQEAVDFARFAINTTIEAMRFTNVNKSVGGPIEILVLKPGEAKWISHKELH